jgi:uncharacterized protein (DUF1778 family)
MHAAGRKDHSLSMRLLEADIATIDRAASMLGRSRTDFVREAALRAAEEVLLERTLVRMSPGAFGAFRTRDRGTRRARPGAGAAVAPAGALGDRRRPPSRRGALRPQLLNPPPSSGPNARQAANEYGR